MKNPTPQRGARAVPAFIAAALTLMACAEAHAWGDLGHEVVALVARSQLTPKAAAEVDRLLALDTDPLKMRDGVMTNASFARQATWADYYRDAQRGDGRTPEQIHSYSWHFVDIELQGGSLETACFGFPKPDPGTPASQGTDPECVVDKIEQFAHELAAPFTPDAEKLLALKFLLHFVGDVHQPLHASDAMDRGGNDKSATVPGGKAAAALHHHWDDTFVQLIGAPQGKVQTDPAAIAAALRTPADWERSQWLAASSPRTWALEAYRLSQNYVYGSLPPPSAGPKPVYALDARYVDNAVKVAADQLEKAGYRLAALLNASLGRP
jgi:hypothetical protein